MEEFSNDPIITLLDESGFEFLEKPYSDSSPIKKFWSKGFWFEKEWGLDFQIQICSHSKNWSMGSLNFDIFFVALTLGPFDMYLARRYEIFPPKAGAKTNPYSSQGPQMSQARGKEWLIYENGEEPCLAFTSIVWAMEDLGEKKSGEFIDVIEKSAYLKAVEELKFVIKFCEKEGIYLTRSVDVLKELGVIE